MWLGYYGFRGWGSGSQFRWGAPALLWGYHMQTYDLRRGYLTLKVGLGLQDSR